MGTRQDTADAVIGEDIAQTAATIHAVPWLDGATAALLRDTVATAVRRHPTLCAAILYGSVARHEERPLTDQAPSDVDVLLLFDRQAGQDEEITGAQRAAIFASVNEALLRHLDAPREVKVLPAASDLSEWDELFVENVARDGISLWSRTGDPPQALQARPEVPRANAEHRAPRSSR
jgi:predicted nucleotidyltransferase